jgi:Uma2 family endonuclease
MAEVFAHPARPFTYADLQEMPDDGYRREIIGGTLIVTPAPTGGHQRVGVNLVVALRAAETPDAMALSAPFDWKLPDGGSVEPDLLVIRRQDFDPAGPLPSSAIPLLVVEILSPSNRAMDRALKRELYEGLGVPAYWIVDPDEPSLLALRLESGSYTTEAHVQGGVFRTDWPFPLEVDITSLPH